MKNFWEKVLVTLEANLSIVLFVVAKADGSTPGRQGFKMLLTEGNNLYGTIGGGIMELNFIKLARGIFEKKTLGFNLKLQIHHKYAPEDKQSGLICSGQQWIIYGLIEPTSMNKDLLRKIVAINDATKTLVINSNHLEILDNEKALGNEERYKFDSNSDSDWRYLENLQFHNYLYIFGSGHVGLALSKIFSDLDFYVIVIDNRTDVESIKTNNYSNELIFDSYENSGTHVVEGEHSYIAIVTTSIQTDLEVLNSCIHKKVRYLGVMGSKSKRKEIFNQLSKRGISEDLLQKIKCPIGISDINSHSAEEIAISVAAEIIKIKNS